jgi:hypothetical protein
MRAMRELSRTLVLCAALAFWPRPPRRRARVAGRSRSTTIEWDALSANGDGGNYLVATGELSPRADQQRRRGALAGLRRISLDPQSGAFTFAVELSSAGYSRESPDPWVGSSLTGPDVT